MAEQELKTWASEIIIDGLSNAPQRNDVPAELFTTGWIRNMDVTYQKLNQLIYLLTTHALPSPTCPVLYKSGIALPSNALEMDGQAITNIANPNLFSVYGATLPDLTGDAPTGFTYIVRNS